MRGLAGEGLGSDVRVQRAVPEIPAMDPPPRRRRGRHGALVLQCRHAAERRRRWAWPPRWARATLKRVDCKPRVAVFSTGDELVMPGRAADARCAIYNSNRFTLRGLAAGRRL